MRFVNFVPDYFVPTMAQRLDIATEMVTTFQGSWEVWAQVEVAHAMLTRNGLHSCAFYRERSFPASRQKCDFVIDPLNAQGNLIWVELKVMLAAGPADLVGRFMGDVEKIVRQFDTGNLGNNTGGALGYSPNNAGTVATNLRNRVDIYDRSRYYYYTFNSPQSHRRYDLTDPVTVNDGHAIVLCRSAT